MALVLAGLGLWYYCCWNREKKSMIACLCYLCIVCTKHYAVGCVRAASVQLCVCVCVCVYCVHVHAYVYGILVCGSFWSEIILD